MVEVKRSITLFSVLLLSALGAGLLGYAPQAQQRNLLPGLEANAEYMELLTQEKQLYRLRDSISGQIDATRKLFATDDAEMRQKYGQQILSLENDLYDVRNRIGTLANAIGAIEQEHIARNMDSPTPFSGANPISPGVPASRQTPNLVCNTYFRENLSDSDYTALLHAQDEETRPLKIIATYLANHKIMDSLARVYTDGERVEAEGAYAKLQALRSINDRLSDSLDQTWDYIFDNKLYVYNYLLDKMNKGDLLSGFERQFQAIGQRVAGARDSVASEAVYAYPLYKGLILDYEYTLAGLLGYTLARDSIAPIQQSVARLNFPVTRIDPPMRNFIEYSPIRTTGSPYNSSNPIPEAENFAYGTVYRIQLGVFQRAQPISLFRGVSPLSYTMTDDGRYRYSAGALRDHAEAQSAFEQMKKHGFRQPQIVVWRDGEFELLDEATSASAARSGFFRIEIEGAGATMNEQLKEVLDAAAPDKEISRVANEQGDYLYTVGTFDSREAAEELVDRLSLLQGITARVLVIE